MKKPDAWAAYVRDVRSAAILGDAADRASVKPGEHVARPNGGAAQVTGSFDVPKCGDTWALEYDDPATEYPLSSAGWLYPMVMY